MARRDEIQLRRQFLRGLEKIFHEAKGRTQSGGCGYWLAPHLWFVAGLTRDEVTGGEEEPTFLTEVVGPPYAEVFTSPVRRYVYRLSQGPAGGPDLRRGRRRLPQAGPRAANAVRGVRQGGRPKRAEDVHFRGMTKVRVMFHDFDVDEPFRSNRVPGTEVRSARPAPGAARLPRSRRRGGVRRAAVQLRPDARCRNWLGREPGGRLRLLLLGSSGSSSSNVTVSRRSLLDDFARLYSHSLCRHVVRQEEPMRSAVSAIAGLGLVAVLPAPVLAEKTVRRDHVVVSYDGVDDAHAKAVAQGRGVRPRGSSEAWLRHAEDDHRESVGPSGRRGRALQRWGSKHFPDRSVGKGTCASRGTAECSWSTGSAMKWGTWPCTGPCASGVG